MGSQTAKLLTYDKEWKRPKNPLVAQTQREEVPMDPDRIARKYWRDDRTFYLIKGVLSPEMYQVLVENMEQLRKTQNARRFRKAQRTA